MSLCANGSQFLSKKITTIDTGSPLIRCNFTTLGFLVLFSRNKCFRNKNWFSIPVNLKVSKKGEGRCHRLYQIEMKTIAQFLKLCLTSLVNYFKISPRIGICQCVTIRPDKQFQLDII
jgi:hypothetical protein